MPPKKAKPTDLETIAEAIRQGFSARDKAREEGLRLSREVIRFCSQAIRAVHRKEWQQARKLLDSARLLLDQTEQKLADQPDILYANYIRDAQKEYAEGNLTLALVRGEAMPTPEELRVDVAPYANGMGEAVGELRRYLLDSIRAGDLSRCESLLSTMDEIYRVLVTMDFPEGVTGGLRRTTDNTRGILERTRGDLTLSLRQRELESCLTDLQEKL